MRNALFSVKFDSAIVTFLRVASTVEMFL